MPWSYKNIYTNLSPCADSKHFWSISKHCHSKFQVRNNHKKFRSIEELLHTFFHTVTLHILQSLFITLKHTPWFTWLEEFPWCSAILKYTGRACTKHCIRIFATLRHFPSPLKENKMLSTDEVKHLFRPLINYSCLKLTKLANFFANATPALCRTPWLCFAIAHPTRCCS
jgi:hypothetical protein